MKKIIISKLPKLEERYLEGKKLINLEERRPADLEELFSVFIVKRLNNAYLNIIINYLL
ncbi:MAG: hypothetical protein NTY48_02825 [Candidatus Diapherotrites archaeon]|nr:hypothetical protein [Candidatus Diapherotrites archaeon]